MVQMLPSSKTTITTIYMMYRCCEEKMMKSCGELMMKITNNDDDIFSYQILTESNQTLFNKLPFLCRAARQFLIKRVRFRIVF